MAVGEVAVVREDQAPAGALLIIVLECMNMKAATEKTQTNYRDTISREKEGGIEAEAIALFALRSTIPEIEHTQIPTVAEKGEMKGLNEAEIEAEAG